MNEIPSTNSERILYYLSFETTSGKIIASITTLFILTISTASIFYPMANVLTFGCLSGGIVFTVLCLNSLIRKVRGNTGNNPGATTQQNTEVRQNISSEDRIAVAKHQIISQIRRVDARPQDITFEISEHEWEGCIVRHRDLYPEEQAHRSLYIYVANYLQIDMSRLVIKLNNVKLEPIDLLPPPSFVQEPQSQDRQITITDRSTTIVYTVWISPTTTFQQLIDILFQMTHRRYRAIYFYGRRFSDTDTTDIFRYLTNTGIPQLVAMTS